MRTSVVELVATFRIESDVDTSIKSKGEVSYGYIYKDTESENYTIMIDGEYPRQGRINFPDFNIAKSKLLFELRMKEHDAFSKSSN